MKDKLLTISKIRFVGKWVEFWFEEEKVYKDELDDSYNPTGKKVENWLHSCKGYVLWDLIDTNGLDDEIMNNGFVGKKTLWVYDSPNWNLKEINN